MRADFDLMLDALNEGGDVTPMLLDWLRLSQEKGWPTTPIGWERYLRRALDGGTLPKRPTEKLRLVKIDPPQPEFRDWWAKHPEGGKGGIDVEVAWKAACYRKEWRAQRQPARREAA